MEARRIRQQLLGIVGPHGDLSDPATLQPLLHDQRGRYQGRAALAVAPSTTRQVAQLVELCSRHKIPIVPQGGNTGLCGGATPHEHGNEILLSLRRMNRIRALDAGNHAITAEAGCILSDVQNAAREADRLFPLSLAAEGSCQIGGVLATNAGGVNVLRYGNARDLVLGLEVVLPDGRVWDGLKSLRKDNTGYALDQLIVGSEGTLGIITAAVLKLHPLPLSTEVALLAVEHVETLPKLLKQVQNTCAETVEAFELMSSFAVESSCRHIPGVRNPFDDSYPWYVLMQLSTPRSDDDLRGRLEGVLTVTAESGLIDNAVIAENLAQRQALWRMRESIPEAQKYEGASIKHDVSVPLNDVPRLLHEGLTAVQDLCPGVRACPFGHLGDGNIHFNFSQPPEMQADEYLQMRAPVSRAVHDLVARLGGSFSAEHGIGRLKRDELSRYKSEVEIDMMKRIKTALDPGNIMNPGKVIP